MNVTPREDDELGFEVLRALRRVLKKVSEHSKHLARESGLTLPQLLCLRAVSEHDTPLSLRALSKIVQLSPPTASSIVARLVRAGLLSRERSQRDRRSVEISLTEAGRERLSGLPRPLQERFLTKLNALDDLEQAEILKVLQQIVEMMNAEDFDAAPILFSGADMSEGTPKGGAS